jgi:hypothetical protein
MLNLRPLDPACPIDKQLQSNADPIVQPHLFAKVAAPNLCAA